MLRRLTLWRMSFGWWLLLLVGMPAVFYAGAIVTGSSGTAAAQGGAGITPAAPGAVCSVCPRCQTRLDKPSKFCPECGAPLG